MVVSESFIWLHIPKTAGDATELMFRELEHPWRLIDPHTDPRKHATLAEARERVPEVRSLPVIANLRRLPELVLSYYHHQRRHAPQDALPDGSCFGDLSFREYLRFVIAHPEDQTFDWILNHYLSGEEPDRWLRVSSLAASFIEVIGGYLPIPEAVRGRIRSISANVGTYGDKTELRSWYHPKEIEALYRNCPRWARTERQVYGSLAT